MNTRAGFTLVEIMVVIGIIGIIAAFIVPNINQGSAQSRDAERKADLRTVQGALELYKNKYGRYPEGCNDTASSWTGNWSGQRGSGTGYECGDGSAEYIRNDLSGTVGVTENFAPQFIPVLPTDPFLNDDVANSGYVYTTNPEGTVYKFMALNTVEDEVVSRGLEGSGSAAFLNRAHPLARCGDFTIDAPQIVCSNVPDEPGTSATAGTYNSVGGTPSQCNTSSEYNNDYAVWGGFAPGGPNNFDTEYITTERAREYYSDIIHCK